MCSGDLHYFKHRQQVSLAMLIFAHFSYCKIFTVQKDIQVHICFVHVLGLWTINWVSVTAYWLGVTAINTKIKGKFITLFYLFDTNTLFPTPGL